jgi:hypothetical protein
VKRRAAVAAYALGCWAGMLAHMAWVAGTGGNPGKIGWTESVVLAIPIALLPALTFALGLRLATPRGLIFGTLHGWALSATAGAATLLVLVGIVEGSRWLGVGRALFSGAIGGLVLLLPIGLAMGLAVAALNQRAIERRQRRPS